MNTLEDIRNYFSGDLYATETTGAVIEEAADGYAKISLEIGDRHRNARGAVMGGVYLTLADFACGVAGNHRIGEEPPCVSVNLNMNFLAAAQGKHLYAVAHAVRQGRSIVSFLVDLTDDSGTLVAQAQGINYRLPRKD
ncbi:MAG: PaaI family thioesterase [Lachnospiraceae bacterium]|nr:PaaI family thioesterase [Lachnospiraceae bacterium]